jgi:hypothetical protein
MMIRWPQVDADAALEWSLANADDLEANMLMLLTQESGREDPAAAMAALDEMPPWLQKDWLAGVAKGVAMADPDGALAFLEQHYGEPGYDEGLAGVVDSLAGADPVAAADLVERTGAQAAGRVGWIWAQQDPDAAASWVANLEDPSMRRDGVTNLAANWARADPDAAVDWLLDMPAGAPRDYGLEFALPSLVAAEGELDPSLLDAIGDEAIRERALVSSIATLARSDADEARRLADTLIEDPILREQARQRIAQQSGGTDITSIISSSIDVPH